MSIPCSSQATANHAAEMEYVIRTQVHDDMTVIKPKPSGKRSSGINAEGASSN